MTICAANNENGSCGVSFEFDSHTLETWYEAYVAVYSRDNGNKYIKGHYETYLFKTLKAAVNKFEKLAQKYDIN